MCVCKESYFSKTHIKTHFYSRRGIFSGVLKARLVENYGLNCFLHRKCNLNIFFSRRSSSSANTHGTPQKSELSSTVRSSCSNEKFQRSTWQTRSSLAARGPGSNNIPFSGHHNIGTYPNVIVDFSRPNVAAPILGKIGTNWKQKYEFFKRTH